MYLRISVILVTLLAMAGASQVAMAANLGQLEQFLIQGESDGWIGASDRGVYWLENPASEGAIRYFYTPNADANMGNRHIRIDVDVTNTRDGARAGLLYGLHGDPLR